MRRFSIKELDDRIGGGIIASCQPVVGGPLDKDEMVTAMALACVDGGAKALRIEGARRVSAVRRASEVPVIGIVKRDSAGTDIRITPTLDDVEELIAAGADIIAFDATNRLRPVARETIIETIASNDCYAMADCACMQDVHFALAHGVEFVSTTLSGYVGGETPEEPDYAFLAAVSKVAPRVIAEGRYNTPEQAQEARRLGAWGVTVGTALTRLETMTNWFVERVSEFPLETDHLPERKIREAQF